MPVSRRALAALVGGLALSSGLSAAFAAPVLNQEPQSILGGDLVRSGEFPTVVAVVSVVGGQVQGLCTGTLIHPEWVLTAAHCVLPELAGVSSQAEVTARTVVVLDTTNVLASGGRAIRAADTIASPGFDIDRLGDNDIGLVKLSERVTDRQPTPVNRLAADAQPGGSVVMVGYGATSGQEPPPGQVNAGVEYVLRNRTSTTCDAVPIAGVLLEDSKLLCFSQEDNKGKCSGDSGGPSFASIGGVTKVVGITSFGDNECIYMGADTRVDAEIAFLDEHIPDLRCSRDSQCVAGCGSTDVDCAGAGGSGGGGGASGGGGATTGVDDDTVVGGCATAPGAGGALAWLGAAALVLARRRRR